MYFVCTPAVVALCARLYALSLLNSDDNDNNDKRCSPTVIPIEVKSYTLDLSWSLFLGDHRDLKDNKDQNEVAVIR